MMQAWFVCVCVCVCVCVVCVFKYISFDMPWSICLGKVCLESEGYFVFQEVG